MQKSLLHAARLLWRLPAVLAILANAAGTAVVLGLVAVVNYDVIARGFFNKPFLGAVEVVQFSMVLIVFLQLPDVVRVNRLTRSDGFLLLLAMRWPAASAALRRGINFVSAVMMALIAVAMWPEFVEMYHSQDYFGVPGIFTALWWPVKLAIFGSAALCLVLFAIKVIRPDEIAGAVQRLAPREPTAGGPDVSPIEIGFASVVAIVLLVYIGVYIPIALGLVSFVSIWLMRDNFQLAMNLLKIAVGESVMEYAFATVPLFTFMGLIVSKAGLGADIYQVMNGGFRQVRGGIGMATVGANAVFAAVTGSSIASASVFAKVSVPQMLSYDYNPRFAVGVVAGSSVLGMIIPPSAMLIIYSFVAEQSVGDMFLAGIVPGLLLAVAYVVLIWGMGRFAPDWLGGRRAYDAPRLSLWEIADKTLPTLALITVVLGGIYTGWLTPVEAGATGALMGVIIALLRRRLTLRGFWDTLLETGHITASILFLITAASIYSRMLGLAGLPNQLADMLDGAQMSFFAIMAIYVALMIFLGTLLDTASIILIVVPLFLPLIEPMGLSLVWFGIVTVVGAEIGLLTPPLGISCFVIKATLNDPRIALKDVFIGAFPFALIMLLVLIALIRFPALSLAILN